MNWLPALIVSFFGAALSALGMGGGGLLLIYLTAYAGMDQLAAQGINLVFFIPVSVIAIFLHAKAGRIAWKLILPFIVLGLGGVYLGVKLAVLIGSMYMSKLFGLFLLVIGIREWLAAKKKEPQNSSKS